MRRSRTIKQVELGPVYIQRSLIYGADNIRKELKNIIENYRRGLWGTTEPEERRAINTEVYNDIQEGELQRDLLATYDSSRGPIYIFTEYGAEYTRINIDERAAANEPTITIKNGEDLYKWL